MQDKSRRGKKTTQRTGPKVDPAVLGETGGPGGPEPVRYGDWERKGIAVDF